MAGQQIQSTPQVKSPEGQAKNRRLFSFALIILEMIIIPIYAVFVRVEPHKDDSSLGYNYPSYMDLIVMVVIGTSYLNTFIKTYSYSGISQAFVFYVVSIQIYFLFAAFWRRVFFGQTLFNREYTEGHEWKIYIRQQDYTLAAYSCSVMNIVFGIIFGRTGFFERLIIVIIGIFVYTFNVIILVDFLKIYDVGGTIFSHIFGAYFGMGLSFIISKMRKPTTKFQNNYETIIFSYLGCFLIFCFAPSINSQYLTLTPFEKSIVIMNTILSMCASVMVSFALSVFLKDKFSVIDLFNGSLCGSIGAGSCTGLFVNPAGCMILGAISGIVCVLGMKYLSGWIENKWGIFDTFGVHNVRGLPGIIGGFGSAIAIALSDKIPQNALHQLLFFSNNSSNSIGKMAAFQIVGTIQTLILAFLAGMFTGKIVTLFYDLQSKNFYMDNVYFRVPQGPNEKFNRDQTQIQTKEYFMNKGLIESIKKANLSEQPSQMCLNSSQSPASKRLTKLLPVKKKINFEQKIDTTTQNLYPPPVQEEEESQHSQIQQRKIPEEKEKNNQNK